MPLLLGKSCTSSLPFPYKVPWSCCLQWIIEYTSSCSLWKSLWTKMDEYLWVGNSLLWSWPIALPQAAAKFRWGSGSRQAPKSPRIQVWHRQWLPTDTCRPCWRLTRICLFRRMRSWGWFPWRQTAPALWFSIWREAETTFLKWMVWTIIRGIMVVCVAWEIADRVASELSFTQLPSAIFLHLRQLS